MSSLVDWEASRWNIPSFECPRLLMTSDWINASSLGSVYKALLSARECTMVWRVSNLLIWKLYLAFISSVYTIEYLSGYKFHNSLVMDSFISVNNRPASRLRFKLCTKAWSVRLWNSGVLAWKTNMTVYIPPLTSQYNNKVIFFSIRCSICFKPLSCQPLSWFGSVFLSFLARYEKFSWKLQVFYGFMNSSLTITIGLLDPENSSGVIELRFLPILSVELSPISYRSGAILDFL